VRSKLVWLVIPVLSLLIVMSLAGQERPNFQGAWTSPEHSGVSLTTTQDEFRVTEAGPLGQNTLVYRLDGSDSRNETKTVRGETWVHVSRSQWVSSALVITITTTRENGASWSWMKIYTMDKGMLKITTVDAVLENAIDMAVRTVSYSPQN